MICKQKAIALRRECDRRCQPSIPNFGRIFGLALRDEILALAQGLFADVVKHPTQSHAQGQDHD